MYASLTLKNAKKSIEDYLIYFITIVICSALFYGFLSLSSDNYELITENSLHFDNLKQMLKYSTYLITFVLTILVFYVNSYVVKRRYKEFGTYMLLGMEQKTVAFMFFLEALFIGFLAVICGLLVGFIISHIITILILISADQEILFNFRFYLDTALETILFFIIIFIFMGLLNMFILNKVKLIDMMNQNKKTDCRFKRSGKLYLGVFIFASACYILSGINSVWLINSIVNKTEINILVTILSGIIFFIIGTYALFYSVSYVLVIIKKRCINFKYEGTNLFLLGGISSKIKTSPTLMATVTITLLGGMISFMISLLMSQWAMGYLEYRIPFDFQIIQDNMVINNESNLIFPSEEILKSIDNETFGGNNFINFNIYGVGDYQSSTRKKLLKLSDFNKLRKTLGYTEANLSENEYLVQIDSAFDDSYIDSYLNELGKVSINNNEFKLKDNGIYKESLSEMLLYSLRDHPFVFVVNDKYLEGENILGQGLFASLNNTFSYEDGHSLAWKTIPKIITNANNNYDEIQELLIKTTTTRIYSVERNNILNATLGVRMLGMYLGVVLFMISLTILGLKLLVDSIEHKDRFKVLEKLGVEEKDISKIILKQISIYFVSSLIIALIGLIIFMIGYISLYKSQIAVYIGSTPFMVNVAISICIMIILYSSYFVVTYKTFKRNIFSD